jgi:hypothetical protein
MLGVLRFSGAETKQDGESPVTQSVRQNVTLNTPLVENVR